MNRTPLTGERLAQARETAEALLDELELGAAPIMNSLLKAKRLARLMRDEDAQSWLDLEATGYPQGFVYSRLGTCLRYARSGGRISHDDKYYFNSLPQFEADMEASRAALQSLQFPTQIAPSVSSSNPHEWTGMSISSAIKQITESHTQSLVAAKNTHSNNARIFNGLKSAIHNFATDCHHALTFGEAAEGMFERARELVDSFVRASSPQAAEQLAAAFERFESGTPEALSHALTSCRRLLQSIADYVFPAREEPFIDSRNKSHKVGAEDYKNRLLAFLDQQLGRTGHNDLAIAEIDLLASRVDALYERTCKGVHSVVKVDEVRLVLVSTFLVIAEVVRFHPTPEERAATSTTPPNQRLQRPALNRSVRWPRA
jgi:hypothetical protein